VKISKIMDEAYCLATPCISSDVESFVRKNNMQGGLLRRHYPWVHSSLQGHTRSYSSSESL